MAIKQTKKLLPNTPEFTNPIIIERRIYIAEVAPSPNGEHSMLGAAYLAIGEYMAENDDEAGYDISFEWGGRSFRAQLEASKQWIERVQRPDEDYDYSN